MALDLAQAQARMIMDDGTQAHDPEYPQRLLEFMRSGWQDKPLEVSTRVEAANYAKRRAQLSAAFPGETLIVATGHEKTRANDTTYSFRPGSDHAWLTGEHDPDAVLVVRPGGDAVLYVRPRSPRDTDELFRDRVYGELWTGRRHTLAEKATELGIETAPLADLPAALDDCAPGRTRVLRGLDPTVDAAVRGNRCPPRCAADCRVPSMGKPGAAGSLPFLPVLQCIRPGGGHHPRAVAWDRSGDPAGAALPPVPPRWLRPGAAPEGPSWP